MFFSERRHVFPPPTAKQGKGKSAAQFVRGLWTCEGPCYELKQKEEKKKKKKKETRSVLCDIQKKKKKRKLEAKREEKVSPEPCGSSKGAARGGTGWLYTNTTSVWTKHIIVPCEGAAGSQCAVSQCHCVSACLPFNSQGLVVDEENRRS